MEDPVGLIRYYSFWVEAPRKSPSDPSEEGGFPRKKTVIGPSQME